MSRSFSGPNGVAPVVVLEGLSLELRDGEMLCVAGRSGSGKTTLLNIASGLLPPTAGEVWWLGERVGSMDEDRRADIRRRFLGIVFQGGGLIQSLTAVENVLLPAIPGGVGSRGRSRALSLLERLGVAHRATALPRQLSGGEQQRVAIARALLLDPPVLVMDEPTANLDRRTADEVIHLVAGFREEGRALLMASHDQHLVERADRVILLD